MTERELLHEVAEALAVPEGDIAEVVHEVLVRVHRDPDDERGHIPLSSLPLTGGDGDGYPVGTRGEAAGR